MQQRMITYRYKIVTLLIKDFTPSSGYMMEQTPKRCYNLIKFEIACLKRSGR